MALESRAVRQRGVAVRPYGGQPAAFVGELRVADGVHTPVDAMQATCGNPLSDRARGQAQREQLLERNDAMLRRRELGERQI